MFRIYLNYFASNRFENYWLMLTELFWVFADITSVSKKPGQTLHSSVSALMQSVQVYLKQGLCIFFITVAKVTNDINWGTRIFSMISSRIRFLTRVESSLQMGQLFNFAMQPLHTTWPLIHWCIGTDNNGSIQTGHSKRTLIRSSKSIAFSRVFGGSHFDRMLVA